MNNEGRLDHILQLNYIDEYLAIPSLVVLHAVSYVRTKRNGIAIESYIPCTKHEALLEHYSVHIIAFKLLKNNTLAFLNWCKVMIDTIQRRRN